MQSFFLGKDVICLKLAKKKSNVPVNYIYKFDYFQRNFGMEFVILVYFLLKNKNGNIRRIYARYMIEL